MGKIDLRSQTKALCLLDPSFNQVVDQFGYLDIGSDSKPFPSLIRYIIYQQLSGKAAGTIFQRFVKLLPDEQITPPSILSIKFENLRNAGLSTRKTEYVLDISERFLSKEYSDDSFADSTDQEVIDSLLKIRGIGNWTADMFLMFTLNRMDIFPVSDLGVRKGFIQFHKMNKEPSWNKIMEMSKKWSPYRTIAALYMWKITDDGFEW